LCLCFWWGTISDRADNREIVKEDDDDNDNGDGGGEEITLQLTPDDELDDEGIC